MQTIGPSSYVHPDFGTVWEGAPIGISILNAMKTYGLIVADNGSDMFISGAPDSRWDDGVLHNLHDVTASSFEAVYTGEITAY